MRFSLLAFLTLTLLLVVGSSACAQSANKVALPTTFEECVAQSGKVLKSFPPRCVSEQGIVFINQKAELAGDRSCRDMCGDGICQEMVCMATGCPCAESAANCPKDCSK